jgi:hypothetical protein
MDKNLHVHVSTSIYKIKNSKNKKKIRRFVAYSGAGILGVDASGFCGVG